MQRQTNKLKSALIACRSSFIYLGLFSFLVNLLMLTVPLYMLQIFDRVLASKSYETLLYLTLIAIVALLVLGLLDFARSRILIQISGWLDNSLSPSALTRSPDNFLQGGNYSSQSLKDITTVRQMLSSPSIFTLFDSPWVPIYILVIFFLHPTLGVIATLGAITLFTFAVINELVSRKPLADANVHHIKNQQHIESVLSNSESIQAMGMLPNIVHKWFNDNETVLQLQELASKRSGIILAISKFVRLTLQLSMLGMGAYYVIQNQLTPGGMIAASIILTRALAPVEQAISVWKQIVNAQQAYKRLKIFFQSKDPRGEKGIQLPKPQGLLSLENVTYIPPKTTKPIIQSVTMQVNIGEIIVIIGSSGTGKSTLARLMLGIWKPNYGHVRLDSAEVYHWDRSDFGNHVGYLPQSVELMTGNIKENIARMKEDVSDESVIAAAKLADAHEMILHLPQGYETNASGFVLSGGQRQRIALARAFYGNPCLLVLDEPNASLDKEGNRAFLNALKHAQDNKITVVVISHRPDILQFADKIVLLNKGKIHSMGPRDEMLQKLQPATKEQPNMLRFT